MCSMICHRHRGWRESWRHTSNKQYCKTSCYVLKNGRMIGIYGVVFFVRFIGIACSCRCWALTLQLFIKKWQFLLSRLNGAKFCERKHTKKFDFSFNNGNSSKPSICTSNAAWRKFMQLMLTLWCYNSNYSLFKKYILCCAWQFISLASSSLHFQAFFYSLKAVAIFTAENGREILLRFMKLHFMVFEENLFLARKRSGKIVIKFIQ